MSSHRSIVIAATLAAGLAAATPPAHAQRRSQHGSVSQRVRRTDITVEYNRPVARGRELFGSLVHWGAYWTPGANEATTIEISDDITVGGHELPAGRYSMWAIPRAEGDWSWIFSSATDAWHIPPPSESREVLRVPVTPREGEHMEVLAFYFPEVHANRAILRFHWGTTVVDIPLALR